jgi:hypothetical protein
MEHEPDTINTLDQDQPDVELMSRALSYLDGLPISMQNKDYQDIVRKMAVYLENFCNHRIIEDDIDTSPESSKKVFYCELCFQPFSSKK